MDILDITFDTIANTDSTIPPKTLGKNDILDAIYTDMNIFSMKHPSMQGYSTPKSYAANMREDMAGYKRSISDDGCFYINQCGKALAITRVIDTEILEGESACKIIQKELAVLEKEALSVAKKYYKDRLVAFYKIVPIAQTYASNRNRSGAPTLTLPTDVKHAASVLPMIIMFPLHSIADLLYPLDLNLENGDAKAAARRSTVLNSNNYTHLNFNAAFANAWTSFAHPDSDTYLVHTAYANRTHPLCSLLFLNKTVMDEWLSGDAYSLIDFLEKKPPEYLDGEGKIFLSFESYGEEQHRYTREMLMKDATRKRELLNGGCGGSITLESKKEAVASLFDIRYNDKSVYAQLVKYDHTNRKDNSMGLCDDCPYKLLCLLGDAGNNNPENPNVCRSIAIVRGLKEAEAVTKSKLLLSRKVPVTVPVGSDRYLTRKGLNLIGNYALDTAMESSPEDWLTANAAIGLISVAARDDFFREKVGVSRGRIDMLPGISGTDFVEEVLGLHGMLDKPVKKYDLSHVRSSNNSLIPELKCIWRIDPTGSITEQSKKLVKNLLACRSMNSTEFNNSLARAEDLFRFILTKPVTYMIDNSALSAGSLLEDYTLAGNIQDRLIKDGLYLKLSSKLTSSIPAMKSDLYCIAAAAISKNSQDNITIAQTTHDESWWPKAVCFLKACAKNNPDTVTAAKKLLAWYAAVPAHGVARREPIECAIAKNMPLLEEVADIIWRAPHLIKIFPHTSGSEISVSTRGWHQEFPTLEFVPDGSAASDRLREIFSENPVQHYSGKSEDGLPQILIDMVVAMMHFAAHTTPSDIKDMLAFICALLSYSDCSVNGSFDNEITGKDYHIDEKPDIRSDFVRRLHSTMEDAFSSQEGAFPISLRKLDGSVVYGYGHVTACQSIHLEREANNTMGAIWKSGLASEWTASCCDNSPCAPDKILMYMLQTFSRLHTGNSDFTDFMSGIDDRLDLIRASVSLDCHDSSATELPTHTDIIANDHTGGTIGSHTESNISNKYYASRVLPQNTIGIRRLHYSAPDELAIDNISREVRKRDPIDCITGTQQTPHISMSHDGRSSSFSVTDILAVHYDKEALVFENSRAAQPDTDISHLHDFNRARHARVLLTDYTQIPDIRICPEETITKVDSRMTAEGRTPADLEIRPYGTMTHCWTNISQPSDSIESIVAAELIRHKQLLAEIISDNDLSLFPDYDIDLSVINTSPTHKMRSTRRYQLRDIFINRNKAKIAPPRVGKLIELVKLSEYTQGTGLLLKRPDVFTAGIANVTEISAPSLKDAGYSEKRPSVLLYQRGILKDVFVEKYEGGDVAIYWTLHAIQNLDKAIKKYSGTVPTLAREVNGEFRSDTVWIKKSGDSWEIKNPPFAIGETVVVSNINSAIRQIIKAAMYYTYRGLLDSDYNIPSLALNIRRPVGVPIMLRTDPWYKYYTRTDSLGALCVGDTNGRNVGSEVANDHEIDRIVSSECHDYGDGYNRKIGGKETGYCAANAQAVPLMPSLAMSVRALSRGGAYGHPYLTRSAYAPFNNPVVSVGRVRAVSANTAVSTEMGTAIINKRELKAMLVEAMQCKQAYERMYEAMGDYCKFEQMDGLSLLDKHGYSVKSFLMQRGFSDQVDCDDLQLNDRVLLAVSQIIRSNVLTGSVHAGMFVDDSGGHLLIQVINTTAVKVRSVLELLKNYVFYRNEGQNSSLYVTSTYTAATRPEHYKTYDGLDLQMLAVGERADRVAATYPAITDAIPEAVLNSYIARAWPGSEIAANNIRRLLLVAYRTWLLAVIDKSSAVCQGIRDSLAAKTLQLYTGDEKFAKSAHFKCAGKYVTLNAAGALRQAIDSLSEIDI